jgi:fructose/tagatose bisphosphate aldolase
VNVRSPASVRPPRQKCTRRIPRLIFFYADRTHSLAKSEETAKAGFAEIIVDGSELQFEENTGQTKKAVRAIKSINRAIS